PARPVCTSRQTRNAVISMSSFEPAAPAGSLIAATLPPTVPAASGGRRDARAASARDRCRAPIRGSQRCRVVRARRRHGTSAPPWLYRERRTLVPPDRRAPRVFEGGPAVRPAVRRSAMSSAGFLAACAVIATALAWDASASDAP